MRLGGARSQRPAEAQVRLGGAHGLRLNASYHQDYLAHNPTNPYIAYNDLPKIENLKRVFPNYYSDRPVKWER